MARLFGTDGIRGIAGKELTCELAMKIGRGAAQILAAEKGGVKQDIIIGRDTRPSGDMLFAALVAGITSAGANAVDLGIISTPAVAYLIKKYGAAAGIMISASHNPSQYNGIKIIGSNGFKLADEQEDRIEETVTGEVPTRYASSFGKVSRAAGALSDYLSHIKSCVENNLDGMSIAVDCANGSAAMSARGLFESLGAHPYMIGCSLDGNINENCGSTNVTALREYVLSNRLSLGVAFDGDADRCICVDEKGNTVDGDMIMAIIAGELARQGKLRANTVVGTVMANFGFDRFCEENKINFIKTKVGDRYVLEEMLLCDSNFGGEQSGHIIMRDYATTGDGQITAAVLISILARRGMKLSEAAAVMKRCPQSERNITATPEQKLYFYTDETVQGVIAEQMQKLEGRGKIVVRPSGTEPYIRVMVQSFDKAETDEITDTIANAIHNMTKAAD